VSKPLALAAERGQSIGEFVREHIDRALKPKRGRA
jgi:hypothetical protein